MATTTPNFGWSVPTSTDLVKDGATAIETLGDSIDASLVDLKGGTSGQILAKNSNTDMDFVWIANDQGDITGVTAGTGISGGGTSGAVTITNSMATEITASGDIIVGTGSGTFDNLPIGSTGQVLTADTTVSPYKVKWATPASGTTFVGASVSNSTTQSIANNTHTAVTWDTEEFDTDAFHSTATNTSRFTIPAGKGGKYLFNCSVRWDNNVTSDRILEIYKNGTIFAALDVLTGNYPGYMVSRTLNLVATDYVELYVYQNSGTSRTLEIGGLRGWAELLYLGA